MVKMCILFFLMRQHHQLHLTLFWPNVCTAQLPRSLWQVSAEGAVWKMSTIKGKELISQCCTGNPPDMNRSIVQPHGALFSHFTASPQRWSSEELRKTPPPQQDRCALEATSMNVLNITVIEGLSFGFTANTWSSTGCFTEGRSWLASWWRMEDLREHVSGSHQGCVEAGRRWIMMSD